MLPVLLKKCFSRTVLVLISIGMMSVSAFTTYFFVSQPEKKIMMLTAQEQELENRIHDEWYDSGLSSQRADMAVLVSLLTNERVPDQKALRDYYNEQLQLMAKDKSQSLVATLKQADLERSVSVDNIDELYLKKLDVETDINRIQNRTMIFANIAFFLQIAGLVLVIITREMDDFGHH